uniref:BTB domain-containing protein n=1 Tax=Panagrolaimus sp. ES5 TaxID=591445 RepID=A0AC34FM78_9BILA
MKMEYPVQMKWVIKAETLNASNNDISKAIQETTIPYVYYQPLLRHLSSGNVLFCIIFTKDDQAIEAELSISIPSANKTYQMEMHVCKREKRAVLYKVIIASKQELMDLSNNYIKNGNLTIHVKGIIKKQNLKRKYPFAETSLGCIMWKKCDKDFTFFIGDNSIKVHKFVMAERSTYFKAMFDASWKENEENETTVTEFQYTIVKKAVKYCYDFPLSIDTEQEAISLLEFSDYYDIKTLKLEAESFLMEKIDVENVCNFANASIKSNSKIVRLCCINFLVKCLKDSTAVEGIDDLDADFKSQLLSHAFCSTQKI